MRPQRGAGLPTQLDSGAAAAAVLPITLTVPATTRYRVLSAFAAITTSATVGNRQFVIEVQDSSSEVVGRFASNIVITASLTRYLTWSPGLPTDAAAVLTSIRTAMGEFIVEAGWKIVLLDGADIDATLDSVRFMVSAVEVS